MGAIKEHSSNNPKLKHCFFSGETKTNCYHNHFALKAYVTVTKILPWACKITEVVLCPAHKDFLNTNVWCTLTVT